MLMLIGAVLVPLLGIFSSFAPGRISVALILCRGRSVLCFVGGPLRMLFAGLFEEGAPSGQFVMPSNLCATGDTLCRACYCAASGKRSSDCRMEIASPDSRDCGSAQRYRSHHPLAGRLNLSRRAKLIEARTSCPPGRAAGSTFEIRSIRAGVRLFALRWTECSRSG